MDLGISPWAALGFVFAAYAVVGNDALQTLGTFINSNRKLPWWALFLFAATVLCIVFAFGYIQFNGDPSWGRLSNTAKYPVFQVEWFHVIPAMALLILTRFGIPVSTSFMILSIFATMSGLTSMIQKSLYAYAMSFVVGGVLYSLLAPTIERHFLRTPDRAQKPIWILLQWVTTAYLWGVWLIQDMANIFVFLPRQLNHTQAGIGVGVILVLLLITFANGGGPVQRILKSKTSVTDIRSATIIDFTYASLLAYFAYISKTPMSTTWAFLGFIAGREFAIATIDRVRSPGATAKIVGMDAFKAFVGLVISIGLAVGMPPLAAHLAQQAGF
ncbi:MAG TPA: hypothetical protein PLV61_01975 [Parvularculaceae bacterium]|nr:hypothetical protein [Amphiplicatus sp.]MCB9956627.1 hypothetical protein [Caulobacterales bacterium]HOP18707.1 hypothetical protein [Amphiplicatus sp.]HPE29928.1 hypothetical protein [Parvularculaceae bacterium]HRX39437.1 hypothetical protein [Parvularculaceae bacterium]